MVNTTNIWKVIEKVLELKTIIIVMNKVLKSMVNNITILVKIMNKML